ncbi:FixH family protein [Erythrobacter sp. HA6-11]
MMQREFTGRNMLTILVVGFGIVMAVNFLMATLATRGFGGVIVENTYVASQKYNGWLEKAREQDALGWSAKVARTDDGHLEIKTSAVPDYAKVSALMRRPLGEEQRHTIAFVPTGEGTYRSEAQIAEGRWIVRLDLTAGEKNWAQEIAIK